MVQLLLELGAKNIVLTILPSWDGKTRIRLYRDAMRYEAEFRLTELQHPDETLITLIKEMSEQL